MGKDDNYIRVYFQNETDKPFAIGEKSMSKIRKLMAPKPALMPPITGLHQKMK